MTYVELGCRALLGVVFAVAVVGKARSRAAFKAFVDSLAAFGWLPAGRRRLVAIMVVVVEAITVVLVAVPVTAAAGLALAGGTLAAFTASAWRQARIGRPVRCRCFGTDGGEFGSAQLVRNGLLLATAIVGLVAAALAGTGPVAVPGAALAVALGALAGLLVTRWDDLAFVFGPVRDRDGGTR
jgi:hypothetical protein